MRIEAFIQARMGSTRLPGKVLKLVNGKSLFDYQIERLKQAREIDEIVVLTSLNALDDAIEVFCKERNILCFRGSEDNVLERYYQAALQRAPDGVVRITADCPLIDPEVVDQVVKAFRQHFPSFDYISNSLERTFPRGLDVEVFSYQALEKAFKSAIRPEELEHVTVYLYHHSDLFKLKNIAHHPSLDRHRWTVDTPEDFELVSLILTHLYPKHPQFRLNDVLVLLTEHPEWIQINAHIEQKKLTS